MRPILFSVCLLFFATAYGAEAGGGWGSCVKTINQKYYQNVCIPPTKPAGCSDAAWASLNKSQPFPFCPLCPPPKAKQ